MIKNAPFHGINKDFTLGPFPAVIYGRLDDVQGYRILQQSQLRAPREVHDEIKWLALDAWGASLDPNMFRAVGHVKSRKIPGLYHILLVLPTVRDLQPSRSVISLPGSAYRLLGYNPFSALRAGLFAFGDSFHSYPHMGQCPPSASRFSQSDPCYAKTGLISSEDIRPFTEDILKGRDLSLHSSLADKKLDMFFQCLLGSLPGDVLAERYISTFTFANQRKLNDFSPFIACFYAPGEQFCLPSLLHKQPEQSENGTQIPVSTVPPACFAGAAVKEKMEPEIKEPLAAKVAPGQTQSVRENVEVSLGILEDLREDALKLESDQQHLRTVVSEFRLAWKAELSRTAFWRSWIWLTLLILILLMSAQLFIISHSRISPQSSLNERTTINASCLRSNHPKSAF